MKRLGGRMQLRPLVGILTGQPRTSTLFSARPCKHERSRGEPLVLCQAARQGCRGNAPLRGSNDTRRNQSSRLIKRRDNHRFIIFLHTLRKTRFLLLPPVGIMFFVYNIH